MLFWTAVNCSRPNLFQLQDLLWRIAWLGRLWRKCSKGQLGVKLERHKYISGHFCSVFSTLHCLKIIQNCSILHPLKIFGDCWWLPLEIDLSLSCPQKILAPGKCSSKYFLPWQHLSFAAANIQQVGNIPGGKYMADKSGKGERWLG